MGFGMSGALPTFFTTLFCVYLVQSPRLLTFSITRYNELVEIIGFWKSLLEVYEELIFNHIIRWPGQREMKAATDGSLGNLKRERQTADSTARLFQLTGTSRQRWSGWHPQWAGPQHSARSPWSPGQPGVHPQLRCWQLWLWHCSQNTPAQKELDTHFFLQGPWPETVPMAVTAVSPNWPVRICYLLSTSSAFIKGLWETEGSIIFQGK